ncbi:MAG: hypothetical protein ACK4FJ_06525 [Ferrovibrio sp.]|uniref:hypothetical protein n=1 Tax=Ferrovibrio sp. TaxID=1917215 RepID=UPI00391D6E7B
MLGLLIMLAACHTTSQTHETVPAMQMPPRPEATGRIVVFRLEEDKMKGYAPPLLPVVSLNGESLGEFPANTLTIRDVVPGEYQIAVANTSKPETEAEAIKPLKATLNAGDEWYIETGVKIDDCQGPKIRSTTPRTGVLEVDALTGVFDLLRVAHMAANTSCASSLQLEPAWPQTARWRLNPLLQKQGAKPLEYSPASDTLIPKSDLPWSDAERAIRHHFDSSPELYKPFLDPAGRGMLMLKTITLSGGNDGVDADSYEIPVVLEYLHADEEILVGRYVKRPLRYTLRRDERDILTVAAWSDGN